MKGKTLLLTAIAGLAILVGCEKDEETISSIEIAEGETVNLLYGKKTQLHANRYPENLGESIQEWKSSNPGVASVDPLGEVTANAEGEATITITTIHGFSASCLIVVTAIATEEIKFKETSLEIVVGESNKLKVTVSPSDASYKSALVYKSTDETIARVSQDGEVHAVKVGKCQIEVTSPDGVKAVCDLEVKPVVVTDINLKVSADPGISLKKGESYTIEYKVIPSNATNKNLAWITSDAAVATVVDGVVTGVAAGTATITVKSKDDGKFSKSFTVTVTE